MPVKMYECKSCEAYCVFIMDTIIPPKRCPFMGEIDEIVEIDSIGRFIEWIGKKYEKG